MIVFYTRMYVKKELCDIYVLIIFALFPLNENVLCYTIWCCEANEIPHHLTVICAVSLILKCISTKQVNASYIKYNVIWRECLPSACSSWTSCQTRFHSFLCTRCSNPIGVSRGLSRCQDDTRRRNGCYLQARMSVWRSLLGGFGVILNTKRDVAYSALCHFASFLRPESPVWSYTPLSLPPEASFPSSASLLSETAYASILRICAPSWWSWMRLSRVVEVV